MYLLKCRASMQQNKKGVGGYSIGFRLQRSVSGRGARITARVRSASRHSPNLCGHSISMAVNI